MGVIAATMPRCVAANTPSTLPIGNPVNSTLCPSLTASGSPSLSAAQRRSIHFQQRQIGIKIDGEFPRFPHLRAVDPPWGIKTASVSRCSLSRVAGNAWALVAIRVPSPTAKPVARN